MSRTFAKFVPGVANDARELAHVLPTSRSLPPESFVEEVRAALDHLYDYAFLHNHSLTRRLCSEGGADGVTRAQRGTLLLDSIEHLRPEPLGRWRKIQ